MNLSSLVEMYLTLVTKPFESEIFCSNCELEGFGNIVDCLGNFHSMFVLKLNDYLGNYKMFTCKDYFILWIV